MRVVCPNCDTVPPAGATTGVPCTSCGMSLVQVTEDEDLIGTVVDGRFEIVAKLGKGGMGTVYRAKQRSIGREVALKLIDRRFDQDLGAVKRFLREAKLASQLAHPNTVGVIEFGQGNDGRLYLVMELVRGTTLFEVMKKGPLPLARIVRIGSQLCDALEAAHGLAIIHRDLKLENIMVLDGPADRDLIKVLDFGLARSLVDPDSRATATGLISGSPRYMPPEVALAGAEPSPAQDMYSLGVILGEMAIGKVLWTAPTIESLFTAKLAGAPNLDAAPRALRVLVERLLDNEPEHRPTAAQARTALLALDTTAAPVLAPRTTGKVALEATQVGPPSIALSPSKPPSAPTTSAFAPPKDGGPAIELEREWHDEKASKARTIHTPRKRPKMIAGVVAAVLLIGGVVAGVLVIMSRGEPQPEAPSHTERLPGGSNMVSVEIRARPAAEIRIDGHKAGTTPLTLHVRKADTPMLIEATIHGRPQSKQIVPDRDQAVEFMPLR